MKPLSGTVYSWAEGMEKPLEGQRILVTGAAGFIGSHLVKRLIDIGCRVIVMIRPSSNLWRIEDILDQVEIVQCDLKHLRTEELASRLSDVQVVYHLAASGVDQSYQDISSVIQTNVLGTLRILQLAQILKVERFVYCGSCFECGCGTLLSEDLLPMPISEYGASKSAGWILVHTFFRRYSLPVVSLRPFTVYGPLEAPHRLIPYTIIKALDGSNIQLTGGEQARDFIFVEDVVKAFLSAAVTPAAVGGTFNVCTGLATSVREVVSTIVRLTRSTAKPLFGALPYRDTGIWVLSGDPAKAKDKLGWSARTSLRDGLYATIQWFQEHRSRYPVYAVRQ